MDNAIRLEEEPSRRAIGMLRRYEDVSSVQRRHYFLLPGT